MPRPLSAPRRSRRDGNSAVEFALLLPIYLAALAATMDFGWLVYKQTSLDAAADVGCRAASLIDIGPEGEDIHLVYETMKDRTERVISRLGESCVDCTYNAELVGAYPNEMLVCTVSKPFRPALGWTVGARTMNSAHVAHMEYQYE